MSQVIDVCCDRCDQRAEAKAGSFSFVSKLPKGWVEFRGQHFCSLRCLRDHIDERIAAEDAEAADSA